MALKDIIISSFPQYCEKLQSGKQVSFRPIIVLEEKSLLLAKQSKDKITILKTLTDIMSSCFNEKSILSYSICDFEQAFLLLRSKSLGEIESFNITCPETNESVDITINLSTDISVNKNKINHKIKLQDNLILVMSIPTIGTLLKYPNYKDDNETIYQFIASCVKQIVTQKEVIDCSDKSQKELIEFIQNLTPKQFNKIIEYFDSLPAVYIVSSYTTSDLVKRSITIKGFFNLINFFFSHLSLDLYYIQNFQMKYYHHYTLNEIENMIPWERSIYLEQIRNHLQEETDRLNNSTEMNFQ